MMRLLLLPGLFIYAVGIAFLGRWLFEGNDARAAFCMAMGIPAGLLTVQIWQALGD